MLGLLMADDADMSALTQAACDEGVLICTAGKQVLRFVPPLIITKDEIDKVIETLKKVLK